jgi:Zn-dependent protease
MNGSLRIGKVFGIPIGLNYSWFIIFALLSLSLSTGYFPSNNPDWTTAGYWTAGVLASLLLFGSVLVHELAHSVVALRWGIPVKSINLFIFGGVASLGREPDRPLAEFLIAVAGPVASFALALGFGIVRFAGGGLGLEPLVAVVAYLASINLSLAVFNLIPGFPLDGGRIFRAVVWALTGDMNRATRWAARSGRAIALLMIAGGGIMILRGNWGGGLWLAFIGWFLESAASQSAQQASVREALQGYTARDFATGGCQAVDSNTPLDWLVRDHVVPHGDDCFVVTQDQQAEGVATLGQIQQIPRQRWGWTPVRQIMTPLGNLKPVRAGDAAYSVLERMLSEGQALLPVTDESRFVGLVRRDNLLNFAQRRSTLKV